LRIGVPTLAVVIKQLHFNPGADGLVVVLDSDDTKVHDPRTCPSEPRDCRLCKLREIIHKTSASLSAMPGRRAPLQIAVGLAVPALEAWLHPGIGSKVSESSWTRALAENRCPYDRRTLKTDLYGSLHVSIKHETQVMIARAAEAATDLARLRNWFPAGFGALYENLRSW